MSFDSSLNPNSHGGGAIIFTEKYRLRTISKNFLTVLRMVCKLKLVRPICSPKNSGQSALRLIFRGPGKSEDPYFPNSESKRNREIKIFFDFFHFFQWLPKLNRGVLWLNFFFNCLFRVYFISIYRRASNIPLKRCLFLPFSAKIIAPLPMRISYENTSWELGLTQSNLTWHKT